MIFRAIDFASFPDVVKNGSQIETQTALDAFTERPDLISRGEAFATKTLLYLYYFIDGNINL